MHKLTAQDHARVSAAIAEAEERSDGEIIAVATERSDKYHDAALHYAALAAFLWLGATAIWPPILTGPYRFVFDSWTAPTLQGQLLLSFGIALALFLGTLAILRIMPIRYALVPGSTKTRRVRRRAIDIYKAGAERRTVGRTGILIYLSMGEHRAEIVHDEAITQVVEPDVWAEAMEALLEPVKEGRVVDGICAAIHAIGEVLAQHFPKSSGDTNEIPDKLIEL